MGMMSRARRDRLDGADRLSDSFELVARNETTVDQLVPHIVDEIAVDRASTVAERVNANGDLNVDVRQSRFAEPTVRPSADEQID